MTRPRRDAAAAAPPSAATRPAAEPAPGVIRDGEVYSLREFARRLHWREHALRQARAAGLRMVAFGRERFVLGADVLRFFTELAEQQAAARNTQAGNGEETP